MSSIIEGAEKDEKHETEEDVYKSCESISTLESDSLTLDESVEGDLFEDVRASIQKSSKKSNPASGYSRVPPSAIAGFQVDDSKSSFSALSTWYFGLLDLEADVYVFSILVIYSFTLLYRIL